ncbi:hypothetical protein AVEN_95785-1, partial [Araneus ventricosus]
MSNRAVFTAVHQKLRETGSYGKVYGRGARTADPRPLRIVYSNDWRKIEG